MSGGIYLVQDAGQLQRLTEAPYEAEAVLQKLLEDYSDLLAGEQINPESPRRWLLVKREQGVPSDEDSGSRWQIDHLYLDQDAVPTLVEVKRSTDSRIRREVVGQMLDYAANGVVYWSTESIRGQFEASKISIGENPNEAIHAFLGGGDVESFWQQVKHNLQAGRIRMVFVADVIPRELRRIVEFLNRQMDPAEVIAIEVRQFKGGGQTALVPQVVGKSSAPRKEISTSNQAGRQWDEESFLIDLEARKGYDAADVARSILTWANKQGLRIWWGKGKTDGSFLPMVDHLGRTDWTISVWTFGRVEIQFKQLSLGTNPAGTHPFAAHAARLDLMSRLNAIEGVSIPVAGIDKRPSIQLEVLIDMEHRSQFLAVLDWLVDQLRGQ